MNPFETVFKEEEKENPFQAHFGQSGEGENPFAKSFSQDIQEQREEERPKEEIGFLRGFLNKFKPKPFKGKLEFISDEEVNKLSDPEHRKKMSVAELKKLNDSMNTQREFEQGVAATRGLTFGASKASEPEFEFKFLSEPAQKIHEGVGSIISFAGALGPITKGFSSIFPRVAPFITRMIGAGTTGALQDLSDQFFDPKKEVNPLEVTKTFAKMATLDGSLQALGKTYDFAKNVSRISKVFNVSRGRSFKFIWDEAGKRGLSVSELAEDASKWADLADNLANAAEKGAVTLEVPGEKPAVKPIAEIEGPEIEVKPFERELEDLEIRSKLTEEPEGISEDLSRDVVDTEATNFSEEDSFIFNNSEINGEFQNALLKDGIAKEIDSAFNKLGFNVETPFINIGAPETGFQIKNYYSTLTKKEEQTLDAIKNIGDFDKNTRAEIALLAEKATPPEDPTLRAAYNDVRKFFDDTFNELKEAGILTNPFPESYINRLEAENKLLKDRIEQKVGNKKNNTEAIKNNNSLIKDLRKTKFVSIPARLWFEKNFDIDRLMTRRVVKIINQKKRKTPTIQSMIDDGLISRDDVDIADIMAYYGKRAARDIGLGKILKAAESEGLASRSEKPGFVQLPVYQYPAIKDFHIHPKFAEWLTTYANPRDMGMFGKLSSRIKGFTFYNPVILPFNDLVQQIMATQGTGIKYWSSALRDIRKKTPEFWKAYENGLFSQPYNIFNADFERQWTRSLVENKTLPQKFKQFLLDDKIIDSAYNAISGMAWSIDRVIRMATYRNFLARGMNSREAAQTAALFHGDYAMVHPNTRKQANTLFYTPTFKIVMGKLFSEMLKSPIKIGKSILGGKEIPKSDKAKFLGLIGTIGVIIGFDQLMTNGFGFKRDQFGRKYSKSMEDDEGIDKNLTVSFSNPATLPIKFFWRLIESFAPSNQTALKSLITKNRFELNPIIQIASKLVNNEDSNGDQIYQNFGDDSLTKLAKSSKFIIKQVFPFLKQFADEPFEDPEARKRYFEEVGLIFNSLPGSFTYWGPDSEQQKVRKITQANSEFLKRAKKLAEKGKSITEGELQKHQRLLEKLSEEKD